ncbi:hypothetical protein BU15DRAFT_62792 [Melanogaster broomeanus]|nr:hypothetical protein BU15DRAFT_62792 [Melanogaster broomeanus]
MLTIPDPLLMHVTHLETAHEWCKYFEDLFDLKKSNTTQQEAKCNPRTPVDMRQKHCEDARKLRKCKATANKPESTKAVEPRYISFTGSIEIHQETSMLEKEASQETKKKCEARDQGRVEKRVRRGRKAAERTSEQEAAAREPGEETADEKTRNISLAVMLSSQDDDGRDMAAPCPTVKPQRPEMMCQAANHTATDAVTPNVTSTRPPLPAGTSHELRDEPHKSMGSYPGSRGENDDSRGPGAHCMRVTAQSTQTASPTASEAAADAANPNVMSTRSTGPAGAPCKPQDKPQMEAGQDIDKGVKREGEKGEWLNRKADKKVATAKEPGEGTMDPTTDNISLAAPASSPQVDEPIARRPSEDTADESTNDISLTAPASSPDKSGGATSMSKTTDGTVKMNATAAPPSVPLEGERESQVASGSTGVHGDTTDMRGNAQKCTNSACTSQQHDTSANGKGHSVWTGRHGTAPQDDNDNDDVESRMSGRPPSMPHEGERYAQSMRVTPSTPEKPPSMSLKGECDSQVMNGHSMKGQSPPLEEQRLGDAHSQRHANNTRTGQRHGVNVHSEGRIPEGIVEDPGGCTEPRMLDRPPSMLLEGEQPPNAHPDDGTAARQEHLEAEEDGQHKGRMQGDAPVLPSTLLKGQQGDQTTSSHANKEVHA